jgi:hypothetical protein
MTAYLVRLTAEQAHPHEIVGIFVAETRDALFWLVDEAASPLECECIKLGNGGIYWDAFTGKRVPEAAPADHLLDDWSPLPPDPVLTDRWGELLTGDEGQADRAWEPIKWAEENKVPVAPLRLPPLPPRGRRRGR